MESAGIGRVDDFGKGIAVERKAAARRRGSQADRGRWNGLASLLRRGAARQQENAGANDTNEVHFSPRALMTNIRASAVVGKVRVL